MNIMCVQQHPPLETERLMLRAFTDEDLNALQTIYGDEEANTYLPWFPIKNLTEAKKFFEEHYVQSNQNFSVSTPGPQTTALLARPATADYKYAVCLKSDNVPIGYVNVTMTESHDLGYGLRKEFWHQGITTEACKAVIAQLKKDGVPYITATHDVNNPRSGGVMKQLGMGYQYSYQELWQPKNILVTFRLYQLNLDGNEERVYKKYWDASAVHFRETNL